MCECGGIFWRKTYYMYVLYYINIIIIITYDKLNHSPIIIKNASASAADE